MPPDGGVADGAVLGAVAGGLGAVEGAGAGAAAPGGEGIEPGATTAPPVDIIGWPEIAPPQPHELIVVQVG